MKDIIIYRVFNKGGFKIKGLPSEEFGYSRFDVYVIFQSNIGIHFNRENENPIPKTVLEKYGLTIPDEYEIHLVRLTNLTNDEITSHYITREG